MNARFPQIRKKSNFVSQKEMSRRIAREAHDTCLALSIAILSDVFGYGDKRIKRFTDAYNQLAESIHIGQDTVEQIKANVKEMYGIEV